MNDFQKSREPEYYEIRIQGHLQDKWSEWFEGMRITREPDGNTTLSGQLPDQTALHSVLLKIRNMNLRLISVSEKSETLNLSDELDA